MKKLWKETAKKSTVKQAGKYLAATALLSCVMCGTAFAGSWYQGGRGWNKQPLIFLLHSSQYVFRRKHSVWISKRLPGSTPVPRRIRLLHLTRNEVKKLEKAAQSAR